MKYQAYVILRIERSHTRYTPFPIVSSVGIYGEASPTQEGNYLQVVLCSAEGLTYEEACRRAAVHAATQITWCRVSALKELAMRCEPRYLGPALRLVEWQTAQMREGHDSRDATQSFINTGKVPS